MTTSESEAIVPWFFVEYFFFAFDFAVSNTSRGTGAQCLVVLIDRQSVYYLAVISGEPVFYLNL